MVGGGGGWWLVVGGWWLVVGCGCWLLVVGCWLLVVGCWLLVVVSDTAFNNASMATYWSVNGVQLLATLAPPSPRVSARGLPKNHHPENWDSTSKWTESAKWHINS